jgi:uncharacterized protein (UPF0335 family)
MVFVIKKGASTKEIEAVKKKVFKGAAKGGFDAKKYNGLLKLKGDALEIQKKLRNEWERNPS